MRKKELLKENEELKTLLKNHKKYIEELVRIENDYAKSFNSNWEEFWSFIYKTKIYKVISNKGTTVVWFADESKQIVKLAKGDNGSVYSAVAYAIAKQLYNTNSEFKRCVDKALQEGKK